MLPNNQLRHLLFDAISRGDQPSVSELLTSKFALQVSDLKMNTALHHAVMNNQHELVRLLLDKGADPAIKNVHGLNAVALAIKAGCPETAQLMLETIPSADVKARIANETLSAIDGYQEDDDAFLVEDPMSIVPTRIKDLYESISLLLQAGANPNVPDQYGDPVLKHYLCDDCLPIAELLLQAGAQPNLLDSFGDCLLRNAVVSDPTAHSARLLMQYGARPEWSNSNRDAKLLISAAYHLETDVLPDFLRELLEYGIDPDVRDTQGRTALMHVARIPRIIGTNIVNLLLEYGADADAVDNLGYTVADHVLYWQIRGHKTISLGEPDPHHYALLYAAWHGSIVKAQQALKYIIPKRMLTLALTLAAESGHYAACEQLLNAGAEPNGVSINGSRPLDTAVTHLRVRIMRLLIKHRAAVDGRSWYFDQTPLVTACGPTRTTKYGACKERLQAAKLLLSKGADVHACAYDDPGHTALFRAVLTLHDLPLIELLLAHGANPNIPDRNGNTPLLLAEQYFPEALPIMKEAIQ